MQNFVQLSYNDTSNFVDVHEPFSFPAPFGVEIVKVTPCGSVFEQPTPRVRLFLQHRLHNQTVQT